MDDQLGTRAIYIFTVVALKRPLVFVSDVVFPDLLAEVRQGEMPIQFTIVSEKNVDFVSNI